MPKKEGTPAEAIRTAAQAYFKECDETRERVELKNGDIAYHQVPYTMAGLCARLGVSRSLMEQARGYLDKQTKGEPPPTREERELLNAYRWAAARVEQHVVERALLGEFSANVVTLLLRDWGYGVDDLPKENASPLRVVLEDPEGFSR